MNSPQINLGILILAAGESKRLGSPKQLLDWNGETLLQKSISTAKELSSNLHIQSNIYIVLGAKYEELVQKIHDDTVVICHNEQWFTGIGSSIQCGMEAITTNVNVDSVLIILCDQPFITSEHLQKLVEQFSLSSKGIIATGYSGINGVPAIFSKKYFAELLMLRSEQGAKKLIEKNLSDFVTIIFEDAKIDIDTMEDYNNALYLEKKDS